MMAIALYTNHSFAVILGLGYPDLSGLLIEFYFYAMITGEFNSQVDKIWDAFWTGKII